MAVPNASSFVEVLRPQQTSDKQKHFKRRRMIKEVICIDNRISLVFDNLVFSTNKGFPTSKWLQEEITHQQRAKGNVPNGIKAIAVRIVNIFEFKSKSDFMQYTKGL